MQNCHVYSYTLYICMQLLVTANVPSSLIIFAQKMEAIRSSETSVLTRATPRHIPIERPSLVGEVSTNFCGWSVVV
jgi:hypothetical protein